MTKGFSTPEVFSREGQYEPYVYIVTEESTGKKYIGSRTAKKCRPCELGVSYLTSSSYIKTKWKSDPSSFSVVDYYRCKSNHHTLLLEMALIRTCNAVFSENFINKGHPHVGFSHSGRVLSQEEKDHLSSVLRGRKGRAQSAETRAKIGNAGRGRKVSDETREKLSKALCGKNLGNKLSDETKLKISKAKTGVSLGKGEMSPNFGRTHSEETKKKMSESHAGKRNSFYGKKHSPETRLHLSEAQAKLPRVTCKYCKRVSKLTMHNRWHGEKCPWKGETEEVLLVIASLTDRELAKKKSYFKGWIKNNPKYADSYTFGDYLLHGGAKNLENHYKKTYGGCHAICQ